MSHSGSREKSVLILGESHCTAISRAIGDDLQGKFTAVDVRIGADASKINRNLYAKQKPAVLVLSFGGTEHNILGLIEGEPRYDFHWPKYDDFLTDRTLIPASAIEELLRWRLESSLLRAMSVRADFDCPAYALAPPPPFRDVDERFKLPKAFDNLLAAGISPPSVRRKYYAVQCHIMRQAYAERGIELLPAPPPSRDADGYLQRRFWNQDPTHGNPAYGALVLKHLEEQLDV